MNSLAGKLARRREAILLKSQAQRELLRLQTAELHDSMHFADAAWSFVDKVRQRPLLLAAGVAAIVLIKPRRIMGLVPKALMAWRMWDTIKSLLPELFKSSHGGDTNIQEKE